MLAGFIHGFAVVQSIVAATRHSAARRLTPPRPLHARPSAASYLLLLLRPLAFLSSPALSAMAAAAASPPAQQEVEMDRVMKDVVAPPMWPLGKDKLWDKKGESTRAQTSRSLSKHAARGVRQCTDIE